MKVKYKSITALLAAFRSGEIDKGKWQLSMDNDCSSLQYIGPVPPGVDEFEFSDQKYNEGRALFRGGGYMDIVELCNAAGIPCEWC